MKYSWRLFLVAIGLFLIATSPKTPRPLVSIIIGLIFIILYFVKGRKNS